MQAISLPVISGWQWIRDGFRLFLRQPFALFTWTLMINLLTWLAGTLLLAIGPLYIGILILFGILMPTGVFLNLSGCRHIAANETMLPMMWLQPLQQFSIVKKLLVLGLLFEGLFLLAGVCTFLPFSRSLAESLQATSTTQNLMPFVHAISGPVFILSIVYMVIGALFWHAPILMAWHNIRLGQALFFSGVACWRNKGALLLYTLSWAVLLPAIEMGIYALSMATGLSLALANTVRILLKIVAYSILYSSCYPVYTSIFNINHPRLKLDH